MTAIIDDVMVEAKLYTVRTVIPEFDGHRNVAVSWFVAERSLRVRRRYAELIAGYEATERDGYAEEAIDELFSAAEAEAFVGWIKIDRGATDEDTTVTE